MTLNDILRTIRADMRKDIENAADGHPTRRLFVCDHEGHPQFAVFFVPVGLVDAITDLITFAMQQEPEDCPSFDPNSN